MWNALVYPNMGVMSFFIPPCALSLSLSLCLSLSLYVFICFFNACVFIRFYIIYTCACVCALLLMTNYNGRDQSRPPLLRLLGAPARDPCPADQIRHQHAGSKSYDLQPTGSRRRSNGIKLSKRNVYIHGNSNNPPFSTAWEKSPERVSGWNVRVVFHQANHLRNICRSSWLVEVTTPDRNWHDMVPDEGHTVVVKPWQWGAPFFLRSPCLQLKTNIFLTSLVERDLENGKQWGKLFRSQVIIIPDKGVY